MGKNNRIIRVMSAIFCVAAVTLGSGTSVRAGQGQVLAIGTVWDQESSTFLSATYGTQASAFQLQFGGHLDIHETDALDNVGLSFSINRPSQAGSWAVLYGADAYVTDYYKNNVREGSVSAFVAFSTGSETGGTTSVRFSAVSDYNTMSALAFNGVSLDITRSWVRDRLSYSLGGHIGYRHHPETDEQDVDLELNGSLAYQIQKNFGIRLSVSVSDALSYIEIQSQRHRIEADRATARLEATIGLKNGLEIAPFVTLDTFKASGQSRFQNAHSAGVQVSFSF